jgi:hypothetical protein
MDEDGVDKFPLCIYSPTDHYFIDVLSLYMLFPLISATDVISDTHASPEMKRENGGSEVET